jgi:hypothetical protein
VNFDPARKNKESYNAASTFSLRCNSLFQQESLQGGQHTVPGRQFGHERSQVTLPIPARLRFQLGREEIVQRVVRHSAMSALTPEQIAQIDVLE